jgi:hypothetical protein
LHVILIMSVDGSAERVWSHRKAVSVVASFICLSSDLRLSNSLLFISFANLNHRLLLLYLPIFSLKEIPLWFSIRQLWETSHDNRLVYDEAGLCLPYICCIFESTGVGLLLPLLATSGFSHLGCVLVLYIHFSFHKSSIQCGHEFISASRLIPMH